jgi:signal transduction histidine kinase
MGAILEMDGYDVAVATTAADALRRAREFEFDLVLTDLRLDEADGLSIMAEVRRIHPDTVCIILTGYASLESAIKALREGAYDYLIKPCDVEELRAVVARGVERRQLGMQLKVRVAELEAANVTIRETQSNVEQLQQLDRLKSQFLSMASHELKPPLTSIFGLSQVLLRRMRRRLEMGPPEGEQWRDEQLGHVERLELLNSQTARLGRLIDELLDVSRIDSGKLDFHWAPVDLSMLMQEVAGRLQMTTTTHTIVVDMGGAREPVVVADRDHLEQVLDNLVTNAIKFSPQGGTIRVTLEDTPDSVVLRVSDPGVGIAAEQLDAIFGQFYQAEEPVSRRRGGMGLGLYIAREIVTRHGGRIWAESVPQQGSIFNVALPRRSHHR